MKFSVVTILAFIALGASAAPVAEAEAMSNCNRRGQSCSKLRVREAAPEPMSNCDRRGQSCSKLKRAVELIDDILETEDDSTETPHFYTEGSPYALAKREALKIREAIAEAEAIAEPEAMSNCNRRGQSCSKAKREAIAMSNCNRRGQSCSKAKREALAEAEAEAMSNCNRRGQSCSKAKRSPEAEAEAMSNCNRRGQSCSKLRRAVEIIEDLTAETEEETEDGKASLASLNAAIKAI